MDSIWIAYGFIVYMDFIYLFKGFIILYGFNLLFKIESINLLVVYCLSSFNCCLGELLFG